MKLTFLKHTPGKITSGCLVIFTSAEGKAVGKPTEGIKKTLAGLTPFISNGEFGTLFGNSCYQSSPDQRILFMNMGEKTSTPKNLRIASAKAWKFLRTKKITKIVTDCTSLDIPSVRAILEGFLLADYQYLEFKTRKKDHHPHLKELALCIKTRGLTQTMVKTWKIICEGVNYSRDLMLTPANILFPETLADHAKNLAKKGCFKVTIMKEPEIKKKKMNALLSVSQGSQKEPRFIVMDYKPQTKAKKTIVLVGKAVTFDSGGLSLKPSGSMAEMKGDMGGGATVYGIMSVLKAIKCPHHVIGLVPSVENMPSGSATRPSDVVTSRAGITIEINNTDAEGRLILADALDYAKTFNPDFVIDYATLTGACLVALGPKICAVMGNCPELVQDMVKTGYELDEPFWELPLEEDYEKLIKSDIADISNIASSRWGGAITAGLFLQRFTKGLQWAHCDIAASILEREGAYHPKGGSGAGVRTTIEVLENM